MNSLLAVTESNPDWQKIVVKKIDILITKIKNHIVGFKEHIALIIFLEIPNPERKVFQILVRSGITPLSILLILTELWNIWLRLWIKELIGRTQATKRKH